MCHYEDEAKKPKKYTPTEKRINNLMKRGAILEKLRHTQSSLDDHCLFTDAIQEVSINFSKLK